MGYYELRPKQEQVIRHFVWEWCLCKHSNWEQEVAVLQSIPWGVDQMRRSKEQSIVIVVSLIKKSSESHDRENRSTSFCWRSWWQGGQVSASIYKFWIPSDGPNVVRYAPEPYLPRKLGGTSCRWGSLCQEMARELKLLITAHFTTVYIYKCTVWGTSVVLNSPQGRNLPEGICKPGRS